MTYATWRTEALSHSLWLLEKAGPEYAMEAADQAERLSGGVLKGLGARVRKTVEEKRASLSREKGGRNARS